MLLCRSCLMPNHDSICPVCWLLTDGNRAEALEMARDLEFSCGPFCRFCESDEETFPCDWVGFKPVFARIETAEVGDVWITQQSHKRGRIVEIVNLDSSRKPSEGVFYGRTLWVKIPGHPKPYPYTYGNGASFKTERQERCWTPACFRHTREVDEDRHYCADHWRAWETAAA